MPDALAKDGKVGEPALRNLRVRLVSIYGSRIPVTIPRALLRPSSGRIDRVKTALEGLA